MPGTPEDTYLTREEACDLMRISKTTLYRLGQAGSLVPIKVGRRSVYARSAIDEFMRTGAQTVGLG